MKKFLLFIILLCLVPLVVWAQQTQYSKSYVFSGRLNRAIPFLVDDGGAPQGLLNMMRPSPGLTLGWKARGGTSRYNTTPIVSYLTNGNMETADPPSSWTLENAATLDGVVDERTGGSGVQAMECTRGTANWSGYQDVTTTPGQVYTVGAWRKNVDAITVAIGKSDTDLSDIVHSSSSALTTWNYVSMDFTATEATSRIHLSVLGGAGKKGRFDDVNVSGEGSAEIVSLHHFRNNEFSKTVFAAQCNDKIHLASTTASDNPPYTITSFSSPHIYTLTTGSGLATSDSINEDWVGAASTSIPWAWSGGTAYPDGFLVQHSSTVIYDNGWADVRNDNTALFISAPDGSDYTNSIIYLGHRRRLSGATFYLTGTMNITTATMTVSAYQSGSWVSVSSLSDGTAITGTFAQSGTMTWDEDSADEAYLLPKTRDHLFWYKFVYSGDVTDGIDIYKVTVTDYAQGMTELWSGLYDITLGALKASVVFNSTLGPELLTNSDFETSTPTVTAWTAYTPGGGLEASSIATVADERTGGSGAQSISVTTGDVNFGAYQDVDVVSGAKYRFTGWQKHMDADKQAFVQVCETEAASALMKQGYPSQTISTWEEIELHPGNSDFIATDDEIRVSLYATSGSANVRFDDLSLKEVVLNPEQDTGYADYTGEVTDGTDADYMDIGGIRAETNSTDAIYAGFANPAFCINLKFVPLRTNISVPCSLTVYYWNGDAEAWASVGTLTDGTSDGTYCMNSSGTIQWDGKSIYEDTRQLGGILEPLYWYQITLSDQLPEDIHIWEIAQCEKPDPRRDFPKYEGVFHYNGRAMWYPGELNKSGMDYSQEGTPHVLNGARAGTTGDIFGPGRVNAAIEFSSYAIVSTKNPYRLYLMQGKVPGKFDELMISKDVGVVAPRSLIAVEDAVRIFNTTRTVHAVYFLGPDGFYSVNGQNVINITNEIKDYFDTNSAPYIEPDYMDSSYAWYDFLERTVHWAVPLNTTGSSYTQTTNNVELVYSPLSEEWYDQYIRKYPITCGIDFVGENNQRMSYIGDAAGYVYRTSHGTTDDSDVIEHWVKTVDFLPFKDKPDALNYKAMMRRIKTKAKTSSTGDMEIKVYPDGYTDTDGLTPLTSTSSTGYTVSMANSGYNYVQDALNSDRTGETFSIRFRSGTTSTEAGAVMEIYGYTLDLEPIRPTPVQ